MSSPFSSTRRRFLGGTPLAALGSVSVLSTLLQLKLANQAAAQSNPGDAKSLVCILLQGGIDSFNVLVPTDDARQAEYTASRSNLALDRSTLVPLTPASPPAEGGTFGLHPAMAAIAPLFNGTGAFAGKPRLSFIRNVGTLIRPTTLSQYQTSQVAPPLALFSHSDQQDQWQTSVPQGMLELSGWAGRCADVIHSRLNTSLTSMNISLAGNNLWQSSNRTRPFVVTPSGAPALVGDGPGADPAAVLSIRNSSFKGMVRQQYSNLIQQSFARTTADSLDAQAAFQSAFTAFDDRSMGVQWPGTQLANDLKAAAKGIAIRTALGLRRQTFFVAMGGWDHHGELLVTQAGMLPEVGTAIAAYQLALENLGLADSVVTYTGSEFGRTLRSNGRGTDHAWGGNQMVFGGPVDGGKFFGKWPSLAIGGPDDIGLGGRMLPSTSVDELYYGLLRWFGVENTDMSVVLPNIANFHSLSSPDLPVPFFKPGLV